jgi:hypothetical protein
MTDIFSSSVDPSRDLPRERYVEAPDGPPFVLTQHDPHGFWRVHREHGQIPDQLSGEYTSAQYARNAVLTYINNMPKKVDKVAKGSSN